MEVNNERRGRFFSVAKKVAISVAVATLLSVVSFFIGVSVGQGGHNTDQLTDLGPQNAHLRVARNTDQPNIIEYRISRNSFDKQCTIKVRSPDRVSIEPGNNRTYKRYIKEHQGEVFYRCGKTKYTVGEIEHLLKNNIKVINTCHHGRFKQINCQKLAYMKNLIGSCPNGQPYECYAEDVHAKLGHTPMCHPPREVIPMDCKCYQSETAVCGQKNLPKCHYPANYNECHHKSVSDDGIRHNCICTKSKDLERLPPCSKHHNEQKNDIIVDEMKYLLRASKR